MDSLVYFVRRSDGMIKIGYTKNWTYRWPDLKQMYGDLEFLGYIPSRRAGERLLHWYFTHCHLHHEWFSPDDEMYDLIDRYGCREIPETGRHKSHPMSLPKRVRPKDDYSVAEIAYLYSVCYQTANSWIKKGRFPIIRKYHRNFVPHEALSNYALRRLSDQRHLIK